MPLISSATKAAVKDISGILPRNDARLLPDLYDSVELHNGMDEVDLFPTQANAAILRANYEKNPFSASEIVRINRVGFLFNASVIKITGADQSTTAENVAKFMNNFSNATVEFGRTGGTCFEQELPLKDLMCVVYDVQYISSTVANIHLSTTPLVVLPADIVLPPNESLKVKIDFNLADGYPVAGSSVGLTGGKLYLECHLSGYAYAPSASASIGAQVVGQAPATTPVQTGYVPPYYKAPSPLIDIPAPPAGPMIGIGTGVFTL